MGGVPAGCCWHRCPRPPAAQPQRHVCQSGSRASRRAEPANQSRATKRAAAGCSVSRTEVVELLAQAVGSGSRCIAEMSDDDREWVESPGQLLDERVAVECRG